MRNKEEMKYSERRFPDGRIIGGTVFWFIFAWIQDDILQNAATFRQI